MYWTLMVFSNTDDSLAAEYRLQNVDIDEIRQLWDRPPDDPMPASYPVDESKMRVLRKYLDVNVDLDLQRLSYFVDAWEDDPQ